MKKLIVAALVLFGTLAQACPIGTHPVCVYDPYLGRSVCHCV